MSEPQLCKSLPSITIDRIEILPDPSVRISATVNGIESGLLKDIRLIDYIDFVCVVSRARNESDADKTIKGWLDEGKIWWEQYNEWWYDLPSVEKFLLNRSQNIAVAEYYDNEAIINTSKLAEDYGIIISDTYRTIMGQYTNGRILQDNKVESDFKDYAVIQDLREYRPPDGTKGCAAGSGE